MCFENMSICTFYVKQIDFYGLNAFSFNYLLNEEKVGIDGGRGGRKTTGGKRKINKMEGKKGKEKGYWREKGRKGKNE